MLGVPVAASPELWVPLGRKVASASAELAFAWAQDFEDVFFLLSNIVPAVSSDELVAQTSSDGGSTHDSGASDYEAGHRGWSTGVVVDNLAAISRLFIGGDNAANEGVSASASIGYSGLVTLSRPFDTGQYTRLHGTGGFRANTSADMLSWCDGARLAAARVDGIRFYYVSGNIASGSIDAWGVLPVERAA